ncbi:hypothetical protein ACFCXP_11280 [Streptomyces niveus]|uniref:hypothetical protein n=1 Tax=Streptomyces niveus TaxID=193462 RepID=UPI0035E0DC0E
MPDFPQAFLLHHRGGTHPGLQLPSGRAVLIEDETAGFATVAPTTDDLLKGYPGARIEWPDPGTCQASTIGGLGQALGPCVLRPHTGPVHQDRTGATWWIRTDLPKGT